MPELLLQRLLDGLRATTLPEGVAVLLGLAYILLIRRRSRWAWVAGGFGALLYTWLFARAALPMQAGLQVYYVGMSVYGWVHWSRAGEQPRISTWSWRLHVAAVLLVLAMAAALARLLATETQAAWPYLDSATTIGSLLATWLTARVKLENWLYWIAIDSVLVFLYAAQGLVFTAALFVLYLVIAGAGFRTWLHSYRQPTRA
ncbi:MAG: nicotinamide riboside transporter PnuC [Steroidobacteraceae bacterium]